MIDQLTFLIIYKKIKSFPNIYIAYRVMLTILVSVALAEISFSKLKLINLI